MILRDSYIFWLKNIKHCCFVLGFQERKKKQNFSKWHKRCIHWDIMKSTKTGRTCRIPYHLATLRFIATCFTDIVVVCVLLCFGKNTLFFWHLIIPATYCSKIRDGILIPSPQPPGECDALQRANEFPVYRLSSPNISSLFLIST